MNLKIIGEKINYSIPNMGEAMNLACREGNFERIKEIARAQEVKGASYLDVNVGLLSEEFMGLAIRAIQESTSIPLCLDSDDVSKLEAGLKVYDSRVGVPILNSATESRADQIFNLRRERNFGVVLLVSERMQGGSLAANVSGEEAYETAKKLFSKALGRGFSPEKIYIDPGMVPIGADEQGLVNMTLDTIARINSDSEMKGVHTLVGLTNMTFGLPPKLKLGLQNAFLTLAMRRGLNTIIGCAGREYRLLKKEDPYLIGFQKVLDSKDKLETFVSEIYPLAR